MNADAPLPPTQPGPRALRVVFEKRRRAAWLLKRRYGRGFATHALHLRFEIGCPWPWCIGS